VGDDFMDIAIQRVPTAPLLIYLSDTLFRGLCLSKDDGRSSYRYRLCFFTLRQGPAPRLRYANNQYSLGYTMPPPASIPAAPLLRSVFPPSPTSSRTAVRLAAGTSLHCRHFSAGATRPSERCKCRFDHRCVLDVIWRNRSNPTQGRR
jgi:hypothetical protein